MSSNAGRQGSLLVLLSGNLVFFNEKSHAELVSASFYRPRNKFGVTVFYYPCVTTEPATTLSVTQVLPPIIEPRPITVSPPRIVAFA